MDSRIEAETGIEGQGQKDKYIGTEGQVYWDRRAGTEGQRKRRGTEGQEQRNRVRYGGTVTEG